MRHRLDKKSFNRDTKARAAMLQALAINVFTHGSIITTQAKAKEARRLIEHSLCLAKGNDLSARRQLHRLYGKRKVVNNICERVLPIFKGIDSGFTKISLVGNRRGDNALLYQLSLTADLPATTKEKKQQQLKVTKKNSQTKNHPHNDAKAQQAVQQDKLINDKAPKLPVHQITPANTTRTSTSKGRGK